MNQIRKPSWNFVSADLTNFARCMFISASPISSGLRSSHTVESQSMKILIPLSVLRFFIEILHLCRIDLWYSLVRLVFLRVTMTSSTPGIITGYLPRHWYRSGTSSFITCQKGTYYVQICDQSSYQQMTL
jgi:hypothetical protein